ncbi:MAG TPA: UDP-N-acetylmuramoyl-L-alanine--D-glutamate ligase [Polyangia bacterium]|jgi:UDP-N-acetylmuramoylalanine--D-glutamate ligase|nr:UDP-N-acetylmuramoyl-L-alanine--D-glutamate ligase [Polyangia bacterium]
MTAGGPPSLGGKRVLVVGLGRSGTAAARLCAAQGAEVTVTDRHTAAELAAALDKLPPGVRQELGGHKRETFLASELVVLSPGVPEIPEVREARAAGVAITGEMELASRFLEATIVAVTGTNGKSTTTTLCGAMLRATGYPTFVGGNLGQPLAEAVGTPAGGLGGHCVVETSSFQLETIETFHPRVAVLLNISADHLDRYAGMAEYAAAKARVFMAQNRGDFAVINVDDALVVEVSAQAQSRRLGISIERKLTEGGWIEGDSLVLRLPGASDETYPAELPGLVGRHNQQNALASLLAARLAGATPAAARRALLEFRPLSHRMELVAEARDVVYYDDSKGTNVGAVVAALRGFPRPVVLIAGGRDKGGDYAPLAQALDRVGHAAVLIGEAAPRIAAALKDVLPVQIAPTLQEAVAIASRLANRGDAVVLSPACSSYDMFRDYVHRAEVFRAAVFAVTGGRGPDGSSADQNEGDRADYPHRGERDRKEEGSV